MPGYRLCNQIEQRNVPIKNDMMFIFVQPLLFGNGAGQFARWLGLSEKARNVDQETA